MEDDNKDNSVLISERIVNINELEQILERERIVIEELRKELKNPQPCLEYANTLLDEVAGLHKKAVSFEFLLEHRKVKALFNIYRDKGRE